jgi:hypothetical protein
MLSQPTTRAALLRVTTVRFSVRVSMRMWRVMRRRRGAGFGNNDALADALGKIDIVDVAAQRGADLLHTPAAALAIAVALVAVAFVRVRGIPAKPMVRHLTIARNACARTRSAQGAIALAVFEYALSPLPFVAVTT